MRTIFFFTLLCFSTCLHAQLEAEILAEGIVFPRMGTAQRDALSPSPKSGQCIFNYDTNSLECYDAGGNWRTFRYNWVVDGDGDTFITTEFVHDEDWIRMDIEGQQALWLKQNQNGQLILEPRYQAGNDVIGSGGAGFNLDPSMASNNTLIGAGAGASIIDGDHNVAVGSSSLQSLASGNYNTSIGRESLTSLNTVAYHNTSIGYRAGANLATNSNANTIIGSNTLPISTSASFNIAMGGAMSLSTVNASGNGPHNNVAIGLGAMDESVGRNSIAIGSAALRSNQTGNDNTAIGVDCLSNNSSGSQNIAIGVGSLNSNTGSTNTALGYRAGFLNNGSRNVFIGNQAGTHTVGDDKLAIANNFTKTLISGDFVKDEVHINSILTLETRNTPPSSPLTGTIYMDDGTCCGGVPTLRVYTIGWHNL